MNIAIFWAFWLLYVIAQAQNSIKSSSNGLNGWAGFNAWLRAQAVNLTTRVAFSAVFEGFIVNLATTKISATGLAITSHAVAGVAGYAANAFLYQIFGYLPWLRVEIGELAPPQIEAPGQKP